MNLTVLQFELLCTAHNYWTRRFQKFVELLHTCSIQYFVAMVIPPYFIMLGKGWPKSICNPKFDLALYGCWRGEKLFLCFNCVYVSQLSSDGHAQSYLGYICHNTHLSYFFTQAILTNTISRR